MNEKGTSWIFKKLQDSDNIYYIDYNEEKIKEKGGTYNHVSRTIYWSPDLYARTTNGTILFPATILAHEGAHALQHEKYGDDKYKELYNAKDAQYKRENERKVITTTEQYVAKRHGDIKEDEITRTNHGAINIYIYDTKKYYYIAAEYYRELIIERIKEIRNNK